MNKKHNIFFAFFITLAFFSACSRVNYISTSQSSEFYLKNKLGTRVPSYPVAVLNINNQIIGTANNQDDYIAIWNTDSANSAKGVLSKGNSEGSFNFKPTDSNDTSIDLLAMRFFQFEVTSTKLDSITVPEGGRIDFGDGIVQDFSTITGWDSSITLYHDMNGSTIPQFWLGNIGVVGSIDTVLNNHVFAVRKIYADNSVKTVTIYHNDNDYFFYTDNIDNPEIGMTATNLRGNLPINTKGFQFTGTQQSSFNTFSNVNLNEFSDNIESFVVRWGWCSLNFKNYNFGVLNFKNIKSIDFGSFKSEDLILVKNMTGTTDLPTKYPKLISFGLKQSQYSSDLNLAFSNFLAFSLENYDTGNILSPADYDRILIQLNSTKTNTGGFIKMVGGNNRTSASDAAVAELQSKGVTLNLTN